MRSLNEITFSGITNYMSKGLFLHRHYYIFLT